MQCLNSSAALQPKLCSFRLCAYQSVLSLLFFLFLLHLLLRHVVPFTSYFSILFSLPDSHGSTTPARSFFFLHLKHQNPFSSSSFFFFFFFLKKYISLVHLLLKCVSPGNSSKYPISYFFILFSGVYWQHHSRATLLAFFSSSPKQTLPYFSFYSKSAVCSHLAAPFQQQCLHSSAAPRPQTCRCATTRDPWECWQAV